MAAANEIREFLTTRRARISPADVGIRSLGRRRVQGLRREEVALLANISAEYYVQLERGDVRGASDAVLDGVANALRLDDVERSHLSDLVRAARDRPRRPAGHEADVVRPAAQLVLDALEGAAAFIRNGRLDILAANRLGRALYSEAMKHAAGERPNLARFIFLDEASTDFYVDWDRMADACVGSLRAEAGRDPSSEDLTNLVRELSVHSEAFRHRWAAHDVHEYRTGVQRFRHERVGEITLSFEAFALVAEVAQTMIVYTAGDEATRELLLQLPD